MIRAVFVSMAGALALAACAAGSGQDSYGGPDRTSVGGQAWPYGERDPAYRGMPGDDVTPWPMGQDKLDQ